MTVRAPIIGTDTDSSETFRLAMGGLWVPTSALNARTGVTSTPVLTGTGNLTATVGPFTAVIDGTSNALQGSYPIANDTAATITITAGNTQPRIDLISLQIQDNDYDGSGQHRGIPVVTAGTPAGSPVAPATPANAIPLWTVPVAANATSVVFSSATAVYPRTAAAGGIVPVAGATDKPAAVNGVAYRHRLDVSAGGASPLEWSTDGTTYTPVASVGPQKIATVVLASTTSSMTISVPSGFTHLQGIFTARGDGALSGGTFVYLQLNGDTGSNYYWQEFYSASGSTVANSSAGLVTIMRIGAMPNGLDTANYFATGSFSIGNCGSSVFKTVSSVCQGPTSTSTGFTGTFGGVWQSTAQVTSVVLTSASGNFVAGSSFSLYGMS